MSLVEIKTGSPHIARYDNVISPEHCRTIIDYIASHTINNREYDKDALPWFESDTIAYSRVRDNDVIMLIESYKFILSQLVFKKYNDYVYPHFTDLVVWREGKSMDFHKDDGYEGRDEDRFRTRKYSMVCYLNDDYRGGETVIKQEVGSDYVSTPKQGSVVIFKSNEECVHSVNKITNGTRYTMPIWFTDNLNHCETSLGYYNF